MPDVNIFIDKSNRQQEITLPQKTKKIKFETSRQDCRDILVEFINANDQAMSKPLSKCFKIITTEHIRKCRFTMNSMSVKPIDIKILFL